MPVYELHLRKYTKYPHTHNFTKGHSMKGEGREKSNICILSTLPCTSHLPFIPSTCTLFPSVRCDTKICFKSCIKQDFDKKHTFNAHPVLQVKIEYMTLPFIFLLLCSKVIKLRVYVISGSSCFLPSSEI